jgi:tetratricopeptide (TPR) repeat protein
VKRIACGLVLVAALLVGGRALADPPSPEAVQLAQEKYARGKELFRAGAYREALAEIEVAHHLDPTAKQLVFNLAVVHTKLGEFAAALDSLEDYLKMDLDAAERERAVAMKERLEHETSAGDQAAPPGEAPNPSGAPVAGAPASGPPAAAGPPTAGPSPSGPAATKEVPVAKEETKRAEGGEGEHSRWVYVPTLVGVGVTLTAIGVTTYYGVRALADRPTNFVVGQTGSFDTLRNDNAHAHGEAVAADVSLGVSIVAAAVTAWLWWHAKETRSPESLLPPVQGRGRTPSPAFPVTLSAGLRGLEARF